MTYSNIYVPAGFLNEPCHGKSYLKSVILVLPKEALATPAKISPIYKRMVDCELFFFFFFFFFCSIHIQGTPLAAKAAMAAGAARAAGTGP